MSLSSLVSGGPDCGPSNPLQQFSKQFGGERSAQQDTFVSSGPSTHAFRSQPRPDKPFEAIGPNLPFRVGPTPFDLSPLQHSLPESRPSPSQAPNWANAFINQQHQPANTGWANDFLVQAPKSDVAMGQQQHGPQDHAIRQDSFANQMGPGAQIGMWGGHPGMDVMMHHQQHEHMMAMHHREHELEQARRASQRNTQVSKGGEIGALDSSQWESAFHVASSTSSPVGSTAQVNQSLSSSQAFRPPTPVITTDDPSELAQTAKLLLDSVSRSEDSLSSRETEAEQNGIERRESKFINSGFFELMRRLRDGSATIEGDKVVEVVDSAPVTDVKGKGKAVEPQFFPQSNGTTKIATPSQPSTSYRLPNATQTNMWNMPDEDGMAEMNRMLAHDDAVRMEAQRQQRPRTPVFQDQFMNSFQGDGGNLAIPGSSTSWEEEDFDNDMIVGAPPKLRPPTTKELEQEKLDREQLMKDPWSQQAEWDQLQRDWDEFEATESGIRLKQSPGDQASSGHAYQFSRFNPFLYNVEGARASLFRSATYQHDMHTGGLNRDPTLLDAVLEAEAAVQVEPQDASAWLSLGIRQQENEREDQAINALKHALELNEHLAEAWLALAVSYTNESHRSLALDCVQRWIKEMIKEGSERSTRGLYSNAIDAYSRQGAVSFSDLPTLNERHEDLAGQLIAMATADGGNVVDPDVQIALGVLFNSSEEYDKAADCFAAALAARPEDPALFNRLGATLANAHRVEEAAQYYERAIDLNPSYVRARYNIAASKMNQSDYQSAAEQLLTALSIQQSDDYREKLTNGDRSQTESTSNTLWDNLGLCCLLLQRGDLKKAAESKNLDAFKGEFAF